MVLKLLMFKICAIIGISEIEFFNFSSTERVKGKFRTKYNQSFKVGSSEAQHASNSAFRLFACLLLLLVDAADNELDQVLSQFYQQKLFQ